MTETRMAVMSDYLLDLYARSSAADATAFSTFALDGMRDLLRADKAWWGIAWWGLPIASGPRLLGSFRSELPSSWDAAWEDAKQDDCLAKAISRVRDRAIARRSISFPYGSKLIQLAESFDIHETLCISAELPDQGALMFLALYRGDRRAFYSPDDKRFVQLLMPHLRATWRQNLRERLPAGDGDGRALKAFVTSDGRLVRCDDGFATAVSRQWPNWRGALLPMSLRDAIDRARATPGGWIGPDAWRVRAMAAGLLTLVELRERTLLDRLAPRELQVARLFADGATHKDIAQVTGLMPSTVRHYLKQAYSKLDVDNKARLAGLLCRRGTSGRSLSNDKRSGEDRPGRSSGHGRET